MSHFGVLVIGAEIEKQLAPYHEFECTGEDDEFVADVDITAKAREEYAGAERDEPFAEWVDDYYGAHPVPHGEEPDKTGPHKYGFALLDAAGEVVKVVRRTNPDKHWDWYVVGGRWTGYFKMKPEAERKGPCTTGKPGLMTEAARPSYADVALLCDIDIEGMRAEAEAEAAAEFDKVAPAFEGKAIPSWTEIRERHGEDVDAARKELHGHPVYLAMVKLDEDVVWHSDVREHFCGGDRAAFLKRARDSAMVTFAIVKDGTWFERGSMGWWGCVSGEMDEGEWIDRFARLLDDLPPETPLTVVDCHI